VKQIIILTFFLLTFRTYGQIYILPDGEYIDTTINTDTTCKLYNLYYYQVGGKYPKSSVTLLKETQAYLQEKNKAYEGSGYITFRFRIDCNGHKMKRTQVLHTDENYKDNHFDIGLVNELFLFTNSLNEWKIARDNKDNSFSYNTFITFKIQNGKVVNIIP
jgi:hypothetical protein